jgi:hypothetical protein
MSSLLVAAADRSEKTIVNLQIFYNYRPWAPSRGESIEIDTMVDDLQECNWAGMSVRKWHSGFGNSLGSPEKARSTAAQLVSAHKTR